MAIELGALNQFSDAESIGDPTVVALAAAIDPPRNKGAFWQACAAPETPLQSESFESYSRTDTALVGTVGTWDSSATTGLPILTGIAGMTVGNVLNVGSEWVKISAVAVSGAETGTVSVFSRGLAGTTAAAHTSGDAFALKMSALNDEDIKNMSSFNEITFSYLNYAQMNVRKYDYTKRFKDLTRKGVGTTPEAALMIIRKEKFNLWFKDAAENAINGKKMIGVNGGDGYMNAGLLEQLKDTAGVGGARPVINFPVNGTFTEAAFRAGLLTMKHGDPDTIWLSSKNREIFNGFNGARNIERADMVAGSHVKYYDFNGLLLELKEDSDMPDSEIAVVTMSKCVKHWVINDQLHLREHATETEDEMIESFRGSVGIGIEGVGYDHMIFTAIS